MDVVWHHDKVSEFITIAVEMTQALADDFGIRAISQYTGSVTGIEFVVPALREVLIEFCLSFNFE